MINVEPFLERLEWLKEWMGKEIDRKNLPYGFDEIIYAKDFYRPLRLSKFYDFCIYKRLQSLL